jgi:hypothetical protein
MTQRDSTGDGEINARSNYRPWIEMMWEFRAENPGKDAQIPWINPQNLFV